MNLSLHETEYIEVFIYQSLITESLLAYLYELYKKYAKVSIFL